MALTLVVETEVLDKGENLQVTDATVYGGSNPARNAVLINFTAFDMRTDPPTAIDFGSYDPATVESILIPIAHDGWVQVTMALTTNPERDPTIDDTLVTDVLISERFCLCKANYALRVYSKKCGFEDPSQVEKLMCLNAQFEGIKYLVSENDMKSADMAIERLNLECILANVPC